MAADMQRPIGFTTDFTFRESRLNATDITTHKTVTKRIQAVTVNDAYGPDRQASQGVTAEFLVNVAFIVKSKSQQF